VFAFRIILPVRSELSREPNLGLSMRGFWKYLSHIWRVGLEMSR